MTKKPLKVHLCAPRGFCAGVDRAIQIVELALEKYGPPVYVRHEIVHNRYVVEELKRKGAVFVEELDEVPQGNAPVVFSAHGVPKSVPETAKSRNMFFLDATCPLVSKVHVEAQRLFEQDYEIILIGHEGHPEVIGTMGQLPKGAVQLIENAEQANKFEAKNPERIAFITQTTLSVDDTAEIVEILKTRYPDIKAPYKEDICYATTNRQQAVKQVAPKCDVMFVVGAPNSSNSQRLREVALRAGSDESILIQRSADIDWRIMEGVQSVGLTAGASAPEVLVDEVIAAFRERFEVTVEIEPTAVESVSFKLPRELREKRETA